MLGSSLRFPPASDAPHLSPADHLVKRILLTLVRQAALRTSAGLDPMPDVVEQVAAAAIPYSVSFFDEQPQLESHPQSPSVQNAVDSVHAFWSSRIDPSWARDANGLFRRSPLDYWAEHA